MYGKLLKWLRNYFGFSKTETYGVIVVHLAISVMLVLPIILEYYLEKDFQPGEYNLHETKVSNAVEVKPEMLPADSLFAFDPNLATSVEFVKLGLKKFLAERIINFRSKGGGFQAPDDLNKIFGIDSAWVEKVKPFVEIQQKTTVKSSAPPMKRNPVYSKKDSAGFTKSSPVILDVNLADTTDLKRLRGIGSALSSRIIKFRDLLGGFVDMGQLTEVYGLSPEVLELLSQNFLVDSGFLPLQIKINECTKEELQKHPYVSPKTAELMINYRLNHYPVTPADLEKIPTISRDQLEKILPYLSFE